MPNSKNKTYSLYRHTSPSGKVYIGITNQPAVYRWNNGNGYMNVKKGPFKSAIIKYGWDNIKHEILFTGLDKELAKELEIKLIDHYKKLHLSLNITNGGDGCHGAVPWNKGKKIQNPRKGFHLSDEHKKKLSIAHKGKSHKGHKWTPEQREKLVSAAIGRKRSEDTKRKIAEHSASAREVIELNKEGKIINYFISASAAAKKYNLDCSWIAKACRKKTICSGHYFLYKDDMVDISEIRPCYYRTGKKVVIKNIKTEEIKEFDSLVSCAKYLGYKTANGLKKQISKKAIIKGEWKYVA